MIKKFFDGLHVGLFLMAGGIAGAVLGWFMFEAALFAFGDPMGVIYMAVGLVASIALGVVNVLYGEGDDDEGDDDEADETYYRGTNL